MKPVPPGRTPDIRLLSWVSLAGMVSRANGARACGGIVELRDETPGREKTTRRARRDAPIRADGSYFICDLAAGEFVLTGCDERGRHIKEQRTSLAVDAKNKSVHPRRLDLHLKVVE
jgi:hypothetical protein